MNIEELNSRYLKLSPEERIAALYDDFEKVLFTSSFGTTAAYLLHLFKKVHPQQVVYFLDTTYHFNETLLYKKQLTEQLQLEVTELRPEEWKNKFTQQDKTWNSDPDLCCSINKVEPLDRIKGDFEIWVSGLMATQNKHRSNRKIFEEKEGIIKFFPIIDQSEKEALDYIKKNNLPEHPLVRAGYNSVGCFNCTVAGKGRSGRWVNKSKSECGLHL